MNKPILKNFFGHTKKDISFLILDYNRPAETNLLLTSIKKHIKFNYSVILYSNGGQQEYIKKYYDDNMIDLLLLSKKNEGSGIGTIRLAEICPTEYFIYIQCDNFFYRDFSLEELNQMKGILDREDIGAISLVNLESFSERSFMCKTDFYLKNIFHEGGGTGPTQALNLLNSEQTMTKWLDYNNKKHLIWNSFLIDSGLFSTVETPCGGILLRRCDSQELKVLKLPKQKMPLWNLSEEEWQDILNNNWEPWRIPKASVPWIFFMSNRKYENPKNNTIYPKY